MVASSSAIVMPHQLHEQQALLISFVLSLCVLSSAVSAAQWALSHLFLRSLFSSIVYTGYIVGHFIFKSTMVPYWQCFQIHMQFKFFTLQLLLFNEYECIYGMTYKYIHTYRQTPLELKMLMWGLLRLTPIIEEEKIHKSQQIASVGLTCVGITRSN